MDEADTTKPVQKVGLVDAYLPVRRKHVAEAWALYDKHFGDKLKVVIWAWLCSPAVSSLRAGHVGASHNVGVKPSAKSRFMVKIS